MGQAVKTELYSATGGYAITPSDTAVLAPIPRAIHVGGAGAVAVEHPDGSVATYSGLQAGQRLDVQAIRVLATGTTATLLVAMV